MDSHNIRVFQSQDILCPHDLGQPLCSAASDSLFWVAYNGIVKGYSTQTTQKEFHCLYEFQPLWAQVDSIHYLPDIRRVITVERRLNNSSTTTPSPMNNSLNALATSSNMADFKSNLMTNSGAAAGSGTSSGGMTVEQCCRVYHFEYDKKERKTIITPSTLPIQHFTTFSGGDNALNSELLISVCTYSNQLLTCVKDVISLWKFTNHDTSICVLKLHTSWNVKCISVFNQFIGYGTTKDVRVVELKLKDTQKFEFVESIQEDDFLEEGEFQNAELQHSKNLSLLDIQKKIQSKIQDQFIGPTIETQSSPSTSILQRQRNGSGPLTNKTMAMYWGKSQLESSDEIQIRLDMATKELLPSPATQKYSEAVAITPEDRKKKKTAITFSSNIEYDIVGETTTVDHPAFVNTNYIEACTNLLHKHFTNEESPRSIHFLQNISQKRDFNQNTGMKCILSTSTCGYVYGLSSPQQLLCEFEYTGECLMSAVNSLFLYAITPVGLEIWSVLGSNNGCLLRFHPFIGLKSVSATDKHVILLSKMSSNENVSIAAYYNQQTEKTVLVSDMRSIEKVSRASTTAKEGSRSGSLLPIFTARRKKEEQKSTTQPVIEEFSYNIYALNSVELCEIYEDMLEHAVMYKPQDNAKYMKLLKESHSLLQSKYFELLAKEKKLDRPETDPVIILKTRVDLQNYTTLLKRSFGLIGDAYVSVGQIDKAAYAYSNSDRPIANVFKNLSVREESLLLFLDHVLFDNDMSNTEKVCSEDLGDKILSIYRQRTPHRLSNVILSSNINFSKSHAISLLHEISEEYIKAQQTVSQLEMSQGEQNCNGEQSWFDIMPKDAIVLSLLQLDIGEAEKAITILKSVEGNCLVDFLINYPNLLTPNTKDERFSLFAKTLREYAPWGLLEAVVRLTSANCCPLMPENVLDLLKGESIEFTVEELPITSLVMQQIYLSSLLVAGDYTNEKMLTDNALRLLKVFIAELEQVTLTLKQSDIEKLVNSVKSKVDLINSLNSPQPFMSPSDMSNEDIETPELAPLVSHLSQLQDLKQYCSFLHYSFIPFRENLKWPKEFVNYEFEKNRDSFGNVNSKTLSEKYNDINTILESLSISDATLFSIIESDPFLLMIHLLYSAQGLICFFVQLLSGNGDLFQEFIRIIESSKAHSTVGFETLKILCMTGSKQFKEGIERLFEILGQVNEDNENFKSKMDVLFGFIQEHCKSIDEWKSVLQLILSHIQQSETNTPSSSTFAICPKFLYNLLDRVLRNLALTNTPEEFLTLIPKNGSMKFFFTYIQLCYSNFTMNTTNNSANLNFEIL